MKEKEPKEKNPIMEETKKQILKNGIVVAIIILGFIGMFVGYSILQDNMFSRIWQVITMLILGASIVIFEVAYKKDSGVLAITGIEILVFACYVLTVEYIKIRFSFEVKWYIVLAAIVFLLYFVFKIVVIYTSGRKKLLNSYSDIADIVKEEEPKKKKAVKRRIGEGE